MSNWMPFDSSGRFDNGKFEIDIDRHILDLPTIPSIPSSMEIFATTPKYIAIIQRETYNLMGVFLYKYINANWAKHKHIFKNIQLVPIDALMIYDENTGVIHSKQFGEFKVNIKHSLYKAIGVK